MAAELDCLLDCLFSLKSSVFAATAISLLLLDWTESLFPKKSKSEIHFLLGDDLKSSWGGILDNEKAILAGMLLREQDFLY